MKKKKVTIKRKRAPRKKKEVEEIVSTTLEKEVPPVTTVMENVEELVSLSTSAEFKISIMSTSNLDIKEVTDTPFIIIVKQNGEEIGFDFNSKLGEIRIYCRDRSKKNSIYKALSFTVKRLNEYILQSEKFKKETTNATL